MIEQRTMFVVEASHNISEILAMYDTEKKEVLYYEQEGEVYKRLENEKYFATRQLAENYRTKHQAELRAKFPEIRAFVEEMDNVIEEYFNFDEQEFFGRCAHFGGYHASWRKEYERELKRAKIFRECVRTGYLNINAHSFRPADVEYIKWYDEKAELHLKDSGYHIETADADEYELILDIFGPNRSGYSYNEV